MNFIIDPGHGKDTPGKRFNGFFEYEFNYDVAYRLKSLLEPYGKVVLTMKEPTHPYPETTSYGRRANLQHRCNVANSVEGKSIFISIHANAYSDPDVSGYEIYVFRKSEERYEIAKSIMEAAKEILGIGTEIKNRGIKEANFYVLRHTKMPAVLIEHEFYTNPEGRKKLEDDNFRQKCAQHIFKGLLNYLGLEGQAEEKTEILGESKATLEQMKAWAKNNNATEKFINAAEIYAKYNKLIGIRADVLYCQSAKETNFGKYTGKVTEDMNNFAGIKTKNPKGDRTEDHESFPTMEDGIRAHFNHIAAYIGVNPIGKPHDRYYLVKNLSWAGSIKYVEELGGKWAPNPDYGKSIVRDYLKPLINTKVNVIDYEKLYNDCSKENTKLKNTIRELEEDLTTKKNM
ncbi:N-acetylmuramoyl-L-alanine amidase [Thermohalobacter berrensis]|uniref:MurNAc-LAA domain-containing protein n=1 Tax=Thermohalobacter berrensis TaxID=99594 RepID=A0A419T0X0_9FIRM|nr:N-acetylmuramoyl-L-alanine amidase [Thermohalobacter berrensis]RKD31204.1 hypothetical protein BET03_03495 [Thermohalobacter berrensis]